MNYREYFKGKNILILGLGKGNEAVSDAQFLHKTGANISVFDDRVESRLSQAMTILSSSGIKNIKFGAKFGDLNKDDLNGVDMVLKASNVSTDIEILKIAEQNKIPIEMSQTLFLRMAPSLTLIGILGTCGKSTVAYIADKMLSRVLKGKKEQALFILNPESNQSPLAYLKKVKKDDVALAIIPYEYTDTYSKLRFSPHVAVITSLYPDYLDSNFSTENYIKKILKTLDHQTYNNFIVASDEVIDTLKSIDNLTIRAKILRTGIGILPQDVAGGIRGYHMKENMALATRVAELFKVPSEEVREVVEDFKYLKGRIEFVKKVDSIEYYNDTASTNPHSTLTALKLLSNNRDTVLILGGSKRGTDFQTFINKLPQYVSTIILIPGSGTTSIQNDLLKVKDIKCIYAKSIKEAVSLAKENSRTGEKILFSPGFDYLGIANTRKERGDIFVQAVKELIN